MSTQLHSRLDPNTLLAHGDFVRALARSLVSDPSRADDVAQDALVAALSQPPRAAGTLRMWLSTVVRNLAFQSARREQRLQSREASAARPERVLATAELVEREATRRAVVDALLELAEPYRSVLLLRFYEGLPPREIARTLGVPVETVRTRVKRGLEQLRQRLDRDHGSRAAWSMVLAPWAALDRPSVARPSALHVGRWLAATGVGVCLIAGAWLGLRSTAENSAHPTLAAGTVAAPSEPAVAAQLVAPVSSARASVPAAIEDPPQRPVAAVAPQSASQVVHAVVKPPSRTIVGRVLDARDAPIVNAIVYVGNQIVGRGDEPFKPFHTPPDMNLTHTDAAGQFTLTGSSQWITAWHEHYSSRMVAWSDAERIVLAPRARLRGRVLEADGRPITDGRKISLDRERESVLGADGSFEFSEVELGVRGLQIEAQAGAWKPPSTEPGLHPKPQGPWFGVRLDATRDEPVTLVLGERPIPCELVTGGAPFSEVLDCAQLGLGRTFKLARQFSKTAAPFTLDASTPGPQLLLTRGGKLARFEIEEAATSVRIDLGTGALTVRAAPKTRIYVVPADSDEFVQLMAGRMATQTVRDAGEVRFAPIPDGVYDVGIDSEGIVARVTVAGAGAVVVLE